MVKVVFFGRLREEFGNEMEVEVKNVGELLNILANKKEFFKRMVEYVVVSVNHKLATMESELRDEDVVSIFFPPSGGE